MLADTSAVDHTALGDHEIERHIVRRGCDALHFLQGITDSDEQRRMPEGAQPPEFECAIVVAAAPAEASAVTIEADERQEHDIEQPGARERQRFGLADAEAVDPKRARRCGDLREAHAAYAQARVDARQIHEAAAAQRKRDEAGCVELLGRRGVDADALTGMEMEDAIGLARDLPRGARALRGGY